jgi:hypothetical protein
MQSCSSDSSSPSDSKGLGSIPGESMWDLQWTKWHWGWCFLQYFSSLCRSSVHQCYYAFITVLIIWGSNSTAHLRLRPEGLLILCHSSIIIGNISADTKPFHWPCVQKHIRTTSYMKWVSLSIQKVTSDTRGSPNKTFIFCFLYALYKRDMNIMCLLIQHCIQYLKEWNNGDMCALKM